MARTRTTIVAAGLLAVGAVSGYLVGRLGGPDPAAAALLSACRGGPRAERRACFRDRLTELVRREGVAAAMAALKELARADRSVEREGHVYAHGIGIEAYLHRRTVPETFSACSTDFASGCNHGVIQAYLESQPAVDSATVNALCAPYREPGDAHWQPFQCVHGMGHGLDMMKGGDLPGALGTCDLLASGWERDACYGGAFMENIMGEIAPHHPATELVASHGHHSSFKRLDPEQPLYPCSIMEARFLRACYEIHTSAVLHFTRNDIGKTARVCDTAPEEMRPTCYRSLGCDITSRALRDPAKTRRLCRRAGERYRAWCYFGAAKALIDWSARSDEGMALCRLVDGEPGWLLCYQAVGEQVFALVASEAQRARFCAAARRPEAAEACRYGAGVPGARLPPTS